MAVTVTGTTGTFQSGNSAVIGGTGFGTREDNGGEKNYLPRLWDDFEDGLLDNWTFRVDGTSWEINTSQARTNSTYCAHKKNEGTLDAMQISPSSQSFYYTSFWMYLASDVNRLNNNKYFRAGSTDSNANLVWNSNSNNDDIQMTVEFAVGDTQVDVRSQKIDDLKGSWNFVEIMWGLPVLESSNDFAQVTVNGYLSNFLPDSGGLWPPDETMTKSPYISLGTWFSTTYGIGSGFFYDDVYIDYTQARVMIGNASTWDTCSHFEMQIPTSWSATSIVIDVNRGSFESTDSVYLYIFDEDGAYNSVGYLVNSVVVPVVSNLLCEGESEPSEVTDITPEFSAYITKGTNNVSKVEIQMSATDAFDGDLVYDSGSLDLDPVLTASGRTDDKSYGE